MPEAPPLRPREIHVWHASLDHPPVPLELLRRSLSAEERERSARLAFDERRARFDAAHGLARWILGTYAGRRPEELRFSVGPHGKPHLKGRDSADTALDFNMSDSAGHLLIGITQGAALGVDLELLRPVKDLEGIAGRFFAPAEVERLQAVPAAQRARAFFECWTRKEAFVKAVGDGLQIPLDSFEVTFGSHPPSLHSVNGSEAEATQWSLWGFDIPDEQAIGAVAVRETNRSLVYVGWDDPLRVTTLTRSAV